MKALKLVRLASVLLVTVVLSACAGTSSLVSAPGVSLSDVEITELDFKSQTFLLGFDVTNPNPFPLPVTSVSYGVDLDGHRFATGKTQGNFVVPANGDGEFAISVRLDLLRSSPQLLYTVRDAAMGDVTYALEGSLGVGIPAAKPIRFESSGQVRLYNRNR
jgi:LEA14-like dessication related protein